ncbi:cationic amino acid transporter 2 [Nematostella vectensis]|uniref:cationic amino acid transporter 2 n=1 Tax=Nematostella vectensis TaxID=45351 RepID=UPI001390171C|nr:cationic amino acid transporter 2 [Nematostella vectensis]XP_032237350.1 cationic amino acid transporter 2 [Nematostella vectensis]
MSSFISGLLRRKSQGTWFQESGLARCMDLFDLTVLGLGGMLDAGIYVVIGQLAIVAGPSVIVSFLVATVAALLAGLSYAELSSRITKTGSAYVFTYVTLGEVLGFFVGWSMLAEYIVNAASMAKACSLYINSLSGGAVYSYLAENISWGARNNYVGHFPDLVALALVLCSVVIIGLGVRESKTLMDIIMIMNGTVILFSIVSGVVFADTKLWSTPQKFAPKGLDGIILAIPQCFYCLSGFDTIPTASEEALEPSRTVPKAIVLCLVITSCAYLGISSIITLMVPYTAIDYHSPLAEAFSTRGFPPGYYVVSIGATAAIFASLLASYYAASRLLYSLSYDGLICMFLNKINKSRQVPLNSVIAVGVITGLSSLVFNMRELVELVAVATICTYTSVSVCVLVSRFQADYTTVFLDGNVHSTFSPVHWLKTRNLSNAESKAKKNYQAISESDRFLVSPPVTSWSLHAAIVAIVVYILSLIAFSTSAFIWWENKDPMDPATIVMLCVYGVTAVAAVIALGAIPQNHASFPYMVPLAVPIISILLNVFVIVRVKPQAFAIFLLWVALGALVYFGYGIRHSTEAFVPEVKEFQHEYTTVPSVPIRTLLGGVQPYKKGKNPFQLDWKLEDDKEVMGE